MKVAANHQKVFNNLIEHKNGVSDLYYSSHDASDTIKMIEDAYSIMQINDTLI